MEKEKRADSIKQQATFLFFALLLTTLIIAQLQAVIGLLVMILLPTAAISGREVWKWCWFAVAVLVVTLLFSTQIAATVVISSGFSRTISILFRLPYKHTLVKVHNVVVVFAMSTAVAVLFVNIWFAFLIGGIITAAQRTENKHVQNAGMILAAAVLHVLLGIT